MHLWELLSVGLGVKQASIIITDYERSTSNISLFVAKAFRGFLNLKRCPMQPDFFWGLVLSEMEHTHPIIIVKSHVKPLRLIKRQIYDIKTKKEEDKEEESG